MKQLSQSARIQLISLVIFTFITLCGVIYKVAAADGRISKLEDDNKELKQMLNNINTNVTALYLKFIPNPK